MVFHEVGRPLAIEEHDIPTLSDGEVLVRVTCCTICGSDLHTFNGDRPGPTPSILGHEIIGVVETFAGAVVDVTNRPIKKGDRLTLSLIHI